jgi:hypothetical protein
MADTTLLAISLGIQAVHNMMSPHNQVTQPTTAIVQPQPVQLAPTTTPPTAKQPDWLATDNMLFATKQPGTSLI